MYRKILLASDCSRESLVALREGALIAQALGAPTYLLVIDRDVSRVLLAQGGCPYIPANYGQELLTLGLSRLESLGVEAHGEVVSGDPAQLISNRVRALGIDLIVVGHRRQSFIERWWSGASGAYLVDGVSCSVLIARDIISDDEFEERIKAGPLYRSVAQRS